MAKNADTGNKYGRSGTVQKLHKLKKMKILFSAICEGWIGIFTISSTGR
ncbi:MAG: hypothetical protein LUH20_00280 [Lachnospiraceae bacterium]|nr:hypothetical protein [Lachnospiraceae bacterium]